ncbi:hypothetical protein [Methylocapsa acidiphila]|uniref:hypothetical protein n=1 Tax=Methylocapsa acidiphila TaxID=133552 RepID=UPI000408D552|nr:hypothetical protein [Methylocapsa acidiphila]
MTCRIILYAAAGSFALITSASALTLNKLPTDSGVIEARTVCNDDGRCWREADPDEGVAGGVLRGLEGRSIHRDDDSDRDRDDRRFRDDDRRDER